MTAFLGNFNATEYQTRRFRIYYARSCDRFFCIYSGDFAPLLGVLNEK
jgi:hypothetical protein